MLKLGGIINLIIAGTHILLLFALDSAFRFAGIDEAMAQWAAINPVIPYAITVCAAIAFTVFGLYGLSGAGVIRPLPLLRLGVYFIAGIYLLRGIGSIVNGVVKGGQSLSFIEVIFSLAAICIGMLYLFGGLHRFGKSKQ